MTKQNLSDILIYASNYNITRFFQPMTDTMLKFSINTPKREAAFIAQIAHESGSLKYVKELASGAAYEGRKDLGNTEQGDGVRYKGRGLIQLTGRANYKKASEYFGQDFISHPEMIETPYYAAMVAGWYWDRHGLNQYADVKDLRRITKIINGGYNGLAQRQKYYERACKVLGV